MLQKIEVMLVILILLLGLIGISVQAEEIIPLHVEGTQLCNAQGEPVVLKGVSTHGLAWFPGYVNRQGFQDARDLLGINAVRLAMYTAESGGYCNGGNQTKLKNLVLNGVEYAKEAGMYAIVDWHILQDGNPNTYIEEAKDFFAWITEKLGNDSAVIYEICNEPNGGTTWEQVKSYALQVIPIIRQNAPDAVIIVGTPEWCQRVDLAAKDPITEYDNLLYALHFYAATHKQYLRDRAEQAIQAGLPIIVSEFGISEASGNGSLNENEGNIWMTFLDQHGISRFAWSLCNKNELSALLNGKCRGVKGYTANDLSRSGLWLQKAYGAASAEEEAEAERNDIVFTATEGLSLEISAQDQWENNGKRYVRFELWVFNDSEQRLNDWAVEIEFEDAFEISDIWCAAGDVKGTTLRLTPESYNREIDAKGAVTNIGFILCGDTAPEVKK